MDAKTIADLRAHFNHREALHPATVIRLIVTLSRAQVPHLCALAEAGVQFVSLLAEAELLRRLQMDAEARALRN